MDQSKPRVGIIGSGAMGTLFGYHLARQCAVTMLDSNPAVLASIEQAGGLSVNDAAPRAVRVGMHSRELFGSNVIFLFVKAVDTLRALRPFAGELSPSTPLVSLQNGVGNEDAPGVGRITDPASEEGNTIIGSGGASPATSRSVAELLVQSGMRAAVVYDIRPHLWGKLVANAAINAVSALLECDAGDILKDANAARLAEALAEEAAAVAAALKINLPFANPWQYVTEVIAVGADSRSSMAFDLESGHPSEIDHINGAICAAGRRTGVPTPYNDAMVRLIKSKESLSQGAR